MPRKKKKKKIAIFFGFFDVVKQEIVANKHNKCVLKNENDKYDAIFFNFSAPPPGGCL